MTVGQAIGLRFAGLRALPSTNTLPQKNKAFFDKLLQLAEADEYLATEMDGSMDPNFPYDQSENDTHLFLRVERPKLNYEAALSWHDRVIKLIIEAREAPELKVLYDGATFTYYDTTRRQIGIEAIYSE